MMKRLFRHMTGLMILVMIIPLLIGCAKVTAQFESQDALVLETVEIGRNKVVEKPSDPVREGYRFVGWKDASSDRLWDFSKPVADNITFRAAWEPITYTVTFDSASGTRISPVSIQHGETLTLVQDPKRQGYEFVGWYTDSSFSHPVTQGTLAIVKDTTVYAKWEPIQRLVRYVADEGAIGSVPAERTYRYGTEVVIEEGNLTKPGYRFAHWNTRADGLGVSYSAQDRLTMSDKDVVLYPVWTVPAAHVSANFFHNMILYEDGRLFGTGLNANGQLGDGTKTNRKLPIESMTNVNYVSVGATHTLAIDTNEALWGMGSNSYGQLATQGYTDQHTEIKIMDKVRQAAAGGFHSLVLTTDGNVYAMGSNEDGQLGDNSNEDRRTPVLIAKNASAVSAGDYHSLILSQDGTLWSFGYNDYGQLGDGTKQSRNRPVRVANQVVAMDAGANHSLFVKTDGSLWSFGSNDSGQLGDGSQATRLSPVKIGDGFVTVSAGMNHSLALAKDGTVWAFGANAAGQLGSGSTKDEPKPVPVFEDGAVIAAGNECSLIIDRDGVAWACGKNEYGQLGDGTTSTRNLPVPIQGL
ncbi:MAG: InlB B-repeat-containing protein [Sphaerochaetaceae bacterium]|nr:InlB B-repeat-containing protein [Sphaerochaetaceae bacterium]